MWMPSTTASPTTCSSSAACRWPRPSTATPRCSSTCSTRPSAPSTSSVRARAPRSAVPSPWCRRWRPTSTNRSAPRSRSSRKNKGRPAETQRTPGAEIPRQRALSLARAGSGNPQAAQGTGRILQAHPRAAKGPAPPEGQTRRQDHPAQRRRHAADRHPLRSRPLHPAPPLHPRPLISNLRSQISNLPNS